jgi:hypothetical protein
MFLYHSSIPRGKEEVQILFLDRQSRSRLKEAQF